MGSQAPPSFWEVPGLPRKFPELPRKFSATSPEVLSLWNLAAISEFPRKFPKLPRKFPKLPRKFQDFPGGQPLSLGSLTPSPDSQKLSLILDNPGLDGGANAPNSRNAFHGQDLKDPTFHCGFHRRSICDPYPQPQKNSLLSWEKVNWGEGSLKLWLPIFGGKLPDSAADPFGNFTCRSMSQFPL